MHIAEKSTTARFQKSGLQVDPRAWMTYRVSFPSVSLSLSLPTDGKIILAAQNYPAAIAPN